MCAYDHCDPHTGEAASQTDGPNESATMGDWDHQARYVKTSRNPKNRVKIYKREGCLFGRADVLVEGEYNGTDLNNGNVGND